MKRLITFLLLIFLCFGNVWGYETDEKLYDFVYYVWHVYFPEYYEKYGTPFIACYDASEQSYSEATAYNTPMLDDNGEFIYSIIGIVDKTQKNGYNACEDFKRVIDNGTVYIDQFCIELIAHELCHTVVSLTWPDETIKMYPSHYNSVFLKEANRLLDDYGLDVHVY